MKPCPYCAEAIQDQAQICRFCQRDLVSGVISGGPTTPAATTVIPSKGTAAVLTFFIPGLGQMYKGDVGAGIGWLIFAGIGYMLLIVPGIVIHLCCLADAATGASRMERTAPGSWKPSDVPMPPIWTPRAKRAALAFFCVLVSFYIALAIAAHYAPRLLPSKSKPVAFKIDESAHGAPTQERLIWNALWISGDVAGTAKRFKVAHATVHSVRAQGEREGWSRPVGSVTSAQVK